MNSILVGYEELLSQSLCYLRNRNKNTQATKPFVFSRFWHKQHKLV